jgi:phosphoribosylglycinamide formyltransferase-1
MSKKLSLAVLLSGNGTNFQAIVDSIENGYLKATIKIVISNNKDAFGLKRAENHNIKNLVMDHKDFEDRKSYDQKLKEVIKEESVDFIILAGFMRILGSDFVKNFPNKIINIHPSLLPKYPGLNTHKKVLENKDKEHGVTVHLVDEGLDSGPIIGFIKILVEDDEKEKDLENKIHKIEHFIYPKILSEFQEGRITIVGNKLRIDDVFYKSGKEYFI